MSDLVFRFVFDIAAFASVMVLIVLGLGVVASMMGIFNFAHGEFVLLGAYTMFLCHEAGLPGWTGLLLAPVLVGLLGLVLEGLIIRRFYSAPVVAMLGTYAIGLIIRESVRGALGGLYQTVPEPVQGFITLGALSVSTWRTVIIAVALMAIALVWLLLSHTSLGLRMRGALENPSLARACGISTRQIYSLTFTLGSALAGLAGALIVPLYQLSADMGLRFLVQGFLSVMLGGAGTFEGPVLGAVAVGAGSAAMPWVVPPVLAGPLVFLIALLVARVRPQGFISK